MECTIGWIKTSEGFIIFKNRDSLEKYKKDQRLIVDKRYIALGYKNRKGIWIGVNKFKVFYVSARGPLRNSKESWLKYNEIGEEMLKKARNLEEAKEILENGIKSLKDSANIIIGDFERALAYEIANKEFYEKEYKDFIIKTNHFDFLRRYNRYLKTLEESIRRKEYVKNKIKELDQIGVNTILDILSSHPLVCRHGKISTIGFGIFHITKDKVEVWYSFDSPCKRRSKKWSRDLV